MVTELGFYISCLVKSSLQQPSDPLLRGWPHDRCKAHIPLRCDFVVRRQTGHIDEALRLADRLLIERCDSLYKRIDERVEVIIGKGSIDIPIAFGQIARDVVRAQKHFERASSSHKTRQPCHGATSWHYPGPDFKVRQDRFFAARKTHVAGQGEFTSDTGCASSD